MPLNDGYGVVIGTLHDYYRDPENDYGQYYHGNVIVQSSSGTYKCAIDVDSKKLPNGVEWRVVELGKSDLNGVAVLPIGWHYLSFHNIHQNQGDLAGSLSIPHTRNGRNSRRTSLLRLLAGSSVPTCSPH